MTPVMDGEGWNRRYANRERPSARREAWPPVVVLGLGQDGLRVGSGGQPDPERRFTPDRLAGAFHGIELSRLETLRRDLEGQGQPADSLACGRRPSG